MHAPCDQPFHRADVLRRLCVPPVAAHVERYAREEPMSDPVVLPKSLDELFREYAWDYFALHADHRLRAFHFYILLSTALVGGFALSVRNGGFQRWMAIL